MSRRRKGTSVQIVSRLNAEVTKALADPEVQQKNEAPSNSAAAIASQLVGALQLARVLGNNAESLALLKASRRALLAQYDRRSFD